MRERPRLRATIDRIERDEEGRQVGVLVFEDGQQVAVPAEVLPPGAAAQQVLHLSLRIDREETARRAGEIGRLQAELFGQ